MHHPPEVHLEELAHVLQGNLRQPAIERDAGVVYPGVHRAELLDGRCSQPLHVIRAGDVGHDAPGCAATLLDLGHGFPQPGLVPGAEDHPGSSVSRALGCGQSNTAGGPGDHHDLLLERLESDLHAPSWSDLLAAVLTTPPSL